MPAHDLFLSYNWRDQAAAEALARALRDEGLRVFLDRWYLIPGRPWPQALEAAVGDCAGMAVLLGSNGTGNWQQREKDPALVARRPHVPASVARARGARHDVAPAVGRIARRGIPARCACVRW